MKLKRLLAGFVALAMTATMIPAMVFADESENKTEETTAVETTEAKEEKKKPAEKKPEAKEEKPEAKAEEPEKKEEPEEKPAESKTEDKQPAETENKKEADPADPEDKKTEEPKATEPAESEDKKAEEPAEAPEETKQPDTVTGKVPGDSDSSYPKKAPIKIEDIADIYFFGNSIVWTFMSGVDHYDVTIQDKLFLTVPFNAITDYKTKITDAINNGELTLPPTSEFTITVLAYDANGFLIAKGSNKLKFDGLTVTLPSVEEIPGACIDKSGYLYFDSDYGEADHYELFINNVWAGSAYYDDEGLDLKYEINSLIRDGRLSKPSNNKYTITLKAYSLYTGNVYQSWTGTYTYKSTAKRLQTYTFDDVTQIDGKLKFKAIKDAKKYRYYVYENDYDTDYYYNIDPGSTTSTTIDMNNYISKAIERGMYWNSSYLIEIHAVNKSGTVIAIWSGTYNFNYVSNPLSVKGKTATVKYSKLKKKAQTLSASTVISGVNTGRGSMSYTKQSGDKNISINSTTGKVTIKKKGLKKGKTYSVKVKIFASGNYGYNPSPEKTVTFKIKVK